MRETRGLTPLDENPKKCRCHQLPIDDFAAIQFFFTCFCPDSRVQAAYQEVENTTRNSMMRLYSSMLMSTLLLSGTAVNAQSLETRSTFFSQDKSAPEIITVQPNAQTFYADNDKDTLPERGSGR